MIERGLIGLPVIGVCLSVNFVEPTKTLEGHNQTLLIKDLEFIVNLAIGSEESQTLFGNQKEKVLLMFFIIML